MPVDAVVLTADQPPREPPLRRGHTVNADANAVIRVESGLEASFIGSHNNITEPGLLRFL